MDTLIKTDVVGVTNPLSKATYLALAAIATHATKQIIKEQTAQELRDDTPNVNTLASIVYQMAAAKMAAPPNRGQ